MDSVPKIRSVSPAEDGLLLVCFDNGVEKIYDCRPWMVRPDFALLKTPAFFRAVRVDPGGYGISWNDYIDLAEAELWNNGQPVTGKPCDSTRTCAEE